MLRPKVRSLNIGPVYPTKTDDGRMFTLYTSASLICDELDILL